MLSINKVHLIGNLTRDPEIKDTANGRLARLSVATNRRYRDKETGDMVDAAQYHEVVVFQDRLIDTIESYCQKGTQVSVEGTLEHRSYEDKDGIKRYVTEVVIRPYGGEFQLGNRPDGGGNRDAGGRSNDRGRNDDRGGNRGGGRGRDDDRRNDRNDNRNDNRGGRGYDDMEDDDIPF